MKDLVADITTWREVATKVFLKWDKQYNECLERNNAAILEATKNKTNLPPNFYEPKHQAFVRREAARQILEIVLEMENELRILAAVAQQRSDLGLHIKTVHTNINDIPTSERHMTREEREAYHTTEEYKTGADSIERFTPGEISKEEKNDENS